MGAVTDLPPTRSGTSFVVAGIVFLAVLLAVLIVVTPRLQDNLGLNEGLELPPPDAPVEVPLTLDGARVGVAVWDAEGVCAEVTDDLGTTFRTCARPDPLRPIWAIDAPDEADPAYVILATPPAVTSVGGRTTAGESLDALVQARELPAAWALIPLPDGAVVEEVVAFGTGGTDLGNVECGGEDAPTGGPERLAGGCVVPQQD
jgi:hypothetical protein